jgi:hypothetical protein
MFDHEHKSRPREGLQIEFAGAAAENTWAEAEEEQ